MSAVVKGVFLSGLPRELICSSLFVVQYSWSFVSVRFYFAIALLLLDVTSVLESDFYIQSECHGIERKCLAQFFLYEN